MKQVFSNDLSKALTYCCPFPAGDGMNAYMAYRVSTQVFAFIFKTLSFFYCVYSLNAYAVCIYVGCCFQCIHVVCVYYSTYDMFFSLACTHRRRWPCSAVSSSQCADASAIFWASMRNYQKNIHKMDTLCLRHQRRAFWVFWILYGKNSSDILFPSDIFF